MKLLYLLLSLAMGISLLEVPVRAAEQWSNLRAEPGGVASKRAGYWRLTWQSERPYPHYEVQLTQGEDFRSQVYLLRSDRPIKVIYSLRLGLWHWRVIGIDETGKRSEPSPSQSVVITPRPNGDTLPFEDVLERRVSLRFGVGLGGLNFTQALGAGGAGTFHSYEFPSWSLGAVIPASDHLFISGRLAYQHGNVKDIIGQISPSSTASFNRWAAELEAAYIVAPWATEAVRGGVSYGGLLMLRYYRSPILLLNNNLEALATTSHALSVLLAPTMVWAFGGGWEGKFAVGPEMPIESSFDAATSTFSPELGLGAELEFSYRITPRFRLGLEAHGNLYRQNYSYSPGGIPLQGNYRTVDHDEILFGSYAL